MEKYEIRNLKQTVFPVAFFNDEGKKETLYIRIQGRRGQTPPIVGSTGITDEMRDLERRGFIKLVRVG